MAANPRVDIRKAARHEAFVIGGESATGYHDVQVGMEQQILSPRVQDGEEAELCAEVLRTGANGEQSLRGGAE